MEPSPVVTCPKCSASVRIAPLGIPVQVDERGEPSNNVLTRCHRCQTWSWMTLQPQEA